MVIKEMDIIERICSMDCSAKLKDGAVCPCQQMKDIAKDIIAFLKVKVIERAGGAPEFMQYDDCKEWLAGMFNEEWKCPECGHPIHQGQCYYHEAVTARRCDCNQAKPIDTGHPYDMSDLDSTEDIKPAQPEKRCHNCGHEITEHSEEGCMAYIRCDGACDTCGCTLTREILNRITAHGEADKTKILGLVEVLNAIKVELLGSNRMYILLEFIDQALQAKADNKPSSALDLFRDQTVDLQTFAEELGFYRFFDGKESMTIAEIIEVAKQSLEEKTT